MALLLNIDTATDTASVCVTDNGVSLAYLENDRQKEHAAFIHQAAAEVLKEAGLHLNEIQAFAVTSGPGSYTGLRVGMATAKGFCYALGKPLITIGTLKVMAKAAIDALDEKEDNTLFCPMIDARRMEVFTALYNAKLKSVSPPAALILNDNSFQNYMREHFVIFFGSGSYKFKKILTDTNSLFTEVAFGARTLGLIADIAYIKKEFADLSYAEPLYVKEFYSVAKG